MTRSTRKKAGGFLFCTLAGMLAVSAAHAGDAIWTAQLDVARLRETPAGSRIWERIAAPDIAPRLDAFRAVFRFDPRTDLHTVTAYGTGNREEDTVAVIRGSFDADHIGTVIRGQRGHRLLDQDGHAIHGWTEGISPSLGGPRRFYGAFSNPNTFVFGQDYTAVLQTLNAGKVTAPTLSGDSFLAMSMDAARIQTSDAAQAAILRFAESVSLSIASPGDMLRGKIRLSARDSEVAETLKTVLEGMLGVVRLQAEHEPDWAVLASSSQVRRDGSAVWVDVTLPLDIAERLIRNAVRDTLP